MTSAERDYPGVEALRAEEMQNLDLALCHALEQSIAFVREKGNPLDPIPLPHWMMPARPGTR